MWSKDYLVKLKTGYHVTYVVRGSNGDSILRETDRTGRKGGNGPKVNGTRNTSYTMQLRRLFWLSGDSEGWGLSLSSKDGTQGGEVIGMWVPNSDKITINVTWDYLLKKKTDPWEMPQRRNKKSRKKDGSCMIHKLITIRLLPYHLSQK